jgi:hypothetical protein
MAEISFVILENIINIINSEWNQDQF